MNFSGFRFLVSVVTALALAGCARVSESSKRSPEERPFFQEELETESHGRKTWFDYLVETDPGRLELKVAPDYDEHPPAVLAVLPFCDYGSANFTIDKIPITFRNKREREQWAWTDAQRLRRSLIGFLAQREFSLVNPIAVDAVLKRLGIDNMEKLSREDPAQLGRLLGADAVIYGQVNSYEGYYFALVSAFRVDVTVWMVSTHGGETLLRANGSRYSVDVDVALSPQDILIDSIGSLLNFRDVTLARAEEEVGRELVLRIPVAQKLKAEMASRAVERAEELEAEESDAKPPASPPGDAVLAPYLDSGFHLAHKIERRNAL